MDLKKRVSRLEALAREKEDTSPYTWEHDWTIGDIRLLAGCLRRNEDLPAELAEKARLTRPATPGRLVGMTAMEVITTLDELAEALEDDSADDLEQYRDMGNDAPVDNLGYK